MSYLQVPGGMPSWEYVFQGFCMISVILSGIKHPDPAAGIICRTAGNIYLCGLKKFCSGGEVSEREVKTGNRSAFCLIKY